MSKDTYEAFLAEVLQRVPEDKRAAIEGTLKDDQIAGPIRERVLARSDYSRSMDALRAEREKFSAEVAEARQRIDGWQQWYGQTAQQVAEMKRLNDQYRTLYGDLDGATPRPVGITEDALNQRLRQELDLRDQQAIAFADVLTELKLEHRDAFKERLDTNELIKYATERNLPLQTAYRELIAPRVEEQRTERYNADLKKAREEGAREALSQHRLPTTSSYSEPHVLDQTTTAGKTQRDRVANAVAHWNEQSSHSVF